MVWLPRKWEVCINSDCRDVPVCVSGFWSSGACWGMSTSLPQPREQSWPTSWYRHILKKRERERGRERAELSESTFCDLTLHFCCFPGKSQFAKGAFWGLSGHLVFILVSLSILFFQGFLFCGASNSRCKCSHWLLPTFYLLCHSFHCPDSPY